MKRILIALALCALTAPDATACLAGRARARQVSRTVTTTKVCQAPAVTFVPVTKQVERTVMTPQTIIYDAAPKTIYVPTKVIENVTVNVPVIQAAPPVTVKSHTAERVRGREVIRGVVGIPLTAAARLREVLPCPNCR